MVTRTAKTIHTSNTWVSCGSTSTCKTVPETTPTAGGYSGKLVASAKAPAATAYSATATETQCSGPCKSPTGKSPGGFALSATIYRCIC